MCNYASLAGLLKSGKSLEKWYSDHIKSVPIRYFYKIRRFFSKIFGISLTVGKYRMEKLHTETFLDAVKRPVNKG